MLADVAIVSLPIVWLAVAVVVALAATIGTARVRDGRPAGGMTVTSRLRRLTADRPVLVAIATINAIFGVAAAAILFPLTFGSDAEIYRRGALGIPHGSIAKDFLYPPLTGILSRR